jgi:hypothetical protein
MTDDAPIDAQTVLDSLGKLILRLKSELAEAESLDQNSVSDPTDQGRCSAMYALTAVITFLDEISCTEDDLRLRPLTRLFEALQDTDKGKAHPMFVPKKLTHRPHDSFELKELKMQSALAMQLLMDSGLINSEKVKEKAASEVAKVLCKESVTLGVSREPTRKTVASWRDSLHPKPEFQRRLSAIRQANISPRDKARNALAALSAFAKGMSGDRKHTATFLHEAPALNRKKPHS